MEVQHLFCDLCDKVYHRKTALISHIRWSHSGHDLRCRRCKESFSDSSARDQHLCHRPAKLTLTSSCPLCQVTSTKRELLVHYADHHHFQIIYEKLSFHSIQEFQIWKYKLETETHSSFVKARGSRLTKAGCTKLKFQCHRDGHFRSKGANLRHSKILGSNKINGYCPAKIDVSCNDGGLVVTFLNTHVGHTLDVERLLPSVDRREALMKKGVFIAKLDNLRARHKSSFKFSLSGVVDGDGIWSVNGDGLQHTVRVGMVNCSCSMRCQECAACIHAFTCSCPDSTVRGNMCKHIHLVCRANSGLQATISEFSYSSDADLFNHQGTPEIFVISDSYRSEKDFETKKKNTFEYFNKIFCSLQNTNELEAFKQQMSPIENILDDMRHSSMTNLSGNQQPNNK